MIRQGRRYAVMVFLFVHMVSLWCGQLSHHAYAFTAWSQVHRPQHKQPAFLIGDRTRLGARAKKAAILRSPFSSFSSCTVLKSTEANEGAELETTNRPLADELPDLPDPEAGRIRSELYALLSATFVGVMAGFSVGLFKLSIEAVRNISYGSHISLYILPLIPAFGGVAVWLLSLAGAFPPGLKDTVLEVDRDSRQAAQGVPNKGRQSFGFLRKALASVFTLGTGSSLGPEGPSVEIGMAMGRIGTNIFPPVEVFFGKTRPTESELIQRNRLLLSCGAAAGVSAGFNAPLSGVFFALEIVEAAFGEASKTSPNGGAEGVLYQRTAPASSSITSILLASVLSALISHAILGNHLALTVSDYTLQTPLLELPLYLLLGATSGVVAFAFSQTAKAARALFDGEAGPEGLRKFANSLPNGAKPIIGGLLCGLIGLAFPQILFFGYETLNSLLARSSLSTMTLLSLLVVKTIATALAVGSGLVGGTFAPSLFLGAMTGAAFHNIMDSVFVVPGSITGYTMQLADVPAYAMVGAASVLAALFRAPLTASLLLFELTRDYDVILPLMASAGVGSLIGDIIEAKVERDKVVDMRRDKDPVSWGDLASRKQENKTVD